MTTRKHYSVEFRMRGRRGWTRGIREHTTKASARKGIARIADAVEKSRIIEVTRRERIVR